MKRCRVLHTVFQTLSPSTLYLHFMKAIVSITILVSGGPTEILDRAGRGLHLSQTCKSKTQDVSHGTETAQKG